MWQPDICIYHFPCDDGFGAAWAVWKRWGDEIEYRPTNYGQPVPDDDTSECGRLQGAGMKNADIDYAKAGEIAFVALGRTEPRRNSPSKWRAEDDPLAWWCLTEWIAEQGAYRLGNGGENVSDGSE